MSGIYGCEPNFKGWVSLMVDIVGHLVLGIMWLNNLQVQVKPNIIMDSRVELKNPTPSWKWQWLTEINV